MNPRFQIDPDPAVAGGSVTVTYSGSSDTVEWSADGGATPRHDWIEQPYDLKDGAWSAGETFEYIVASGGQPS